MKVLFVAGRWAQDIDKSERLKELRKHATVDVALSGEEKQLIEKVGDANVIITGGPITAAVIGAASKLKMIQTTSVGFEYIDEAAAAAKGVIISPNNPTLSLISMGNRCSATMITGFFEASMCSGRAHLSTPVYLSDLLQKTAVETYPTLGPSSGYMHLIV